LEQDENGLLSAEFLALRPVGCDRPIPDVQALSPARITRSAFPDGPDSAMEDHVGRVRQFFRRSGAYCQYLRQAEVDAASLFATFEGAFKQREMLVRYLAPLEFVDFLRKDQLDCGSFSIKRFSRADLNTILGTAVNRIFYAAADTEELWRYWFMVAEERQPARGPSYVFYVDLDDTNEDPDHRRMDDFGPVVSAPYNPPPAPIETVLRVLSLFDWDGAAKWSLKESDQKAIKNQFEELWERRCDMVHGRSPGEPSSRAVDTEIRSLPGRSRIGLGSLRGEHVARVAEIRQRARQATLWFARWLEDLRRTYSRDASALPTREQLLSVLYPRKRRGPQREDLQQIKRLRNALPKQFPNVSEWSVRDRAI
jgi:hypothetical protein